MHTENESGVPRAGSATGKLKKLETPYSKVSVPRLTPHHYPSDPEVAPRASASLQSCFEGPHAQLSLSSSPLLGSGWRPPTRALAVLCPCSPWPPFSPQKPVPQPRPLTAPSPTLQSRATRSPRQCAHIPPGPWTSPRCVKQPQNKALTPQGSN